MLGKDKHTSLLSRVINYGYKKSFITFGLEVTVWESRRQDFMDGAIPLMTVLASHVTDIGPMARRKRGHMNGTAPITMLRDGHMTPISLEKESQDGASWP